MLSRILPTETFLLKKERNQSLQGTERVSVAWKLSLEIWKASARAIFGRHKLSDSYSFVSLCQKRLVLKKCLLPWENAVGGFCGILDEFEFLGLSQSGENSSLWSGVFWQCWSFSTWMLSDLHTPRGFTCPPAGWKTHKTHLKLLGTSLKNIGLQFCISKQNLWSVSLARVYSPMHLSFAVLSLSSRAEVGQKIWPGILAQNRVGGWQDSALGPLWLPFFRGRGRVLTGFRAVPKMHTGNSYHDL